MPAPELNSIELPKRQPKKKAILPGSTSGERHISPVGRTNANTDPGAESVGGDAESLQPEQSLIQSARSTIALPPIAQGGCFPSMPSMPTPPLHTAGTSLASHPSGGRQDHNHSVDVMQHSHSHNHTTSSMPLHMELPDSLPMYNTARVRGAKGNLPGPHGQHQNGGGTLASQTGVARAAPGNAAPDLAPRRELLEEEEGGHARGQQMVHASSAPALASPLGGFERSETGTGQPLSDDAALLTDSSSKESPGRSGVIGDELDVDGVGGDVPSQFAVSAVSLPAPSMAAQPPTPRAPPSARDAGSAPPLLSPASSSLLRRQNSGANSTSNRNTQASTATPPYPHPPPNVSPRAIAAVRQLDALPKGKTTPKNGTNANQTTHGQGRQPNTARDGGAGALVRSSQSGTPSGAATARPGQAGAVGVVPALDLGHLTHGKNSEVALRSVAGTLLASPRTHKNPQDAGALALATASVKAVAAPGGAASLLPGTSTRGRALVQTSLSQWPASVAPNGATARSAARGGAGAVASSRPPLAVELEAFLRKEFAAHDRGTGAAAFAAGKSANGGDGAALQKVPIVREAFGCFIGHFPEYAGTLSTIKERYDDAIDDATVALHRLRSLERENASFAAVQDGIVKTEREAAGKRSKVFARKAAEAESKLQAHIDHEVQLEREVARLRDERERQGRHLSEAEQRSKLFERAVSELTHRGAQMVRSHNKLSHDVERLTHRAEMAEAQLREVEHMRRELAALNGESAGAATVGGLRALNVSGQPMLGASGAVVLPHTKLRSPGEAQSPLGSPASGDLGLPSVFFADVEGATPGSATTLPVPQLDVSARPLHSPESQSLLNASSGSHPAERSGRARGSVKSGRGAFGNRDTRAVARSVSNVMRAASVASEDVEVQEVDDMTAALDAGALDTIDNMHETVFNLENKVRRLNRTNHDLRNQNSVMLQRLETVAGAQDSGEMTPRPNWSRVRDMLPEFQGAGHLQSSDDTLRDLMTFVKETLSEDHRLREVEGIGQTVRQWLGEEDLCESDLVGNHRFFVCKGTGPHVPLYLRAKGVVKNRRMHKADVESLLSRFWADRRAHRELSMSALHVEAIAEYFFNWLTKVTGNSKAAIELAYNIFSVCEKSQHDPDCSMFLRIFRGELSEHSIYDQADVLIGLQEALAMNDRKGKGKLSRFTVNRVLSNHFATKSKFNLQRLRFALMLSVRGETLVDYQALFRDDEDANQSRFIELVRQQHVEELVTFTVEVEEALREHIDPTGRLDLQGCRNALKALDPDMPTDEINELLAYGCSVTVEDLLKEEATLAPVAEPFLQRIRKDVLLKRYSRPQPQEGLADDEDEDDWSGDEDLYADANVEGATDVDSQLSSDDGEGGGHGLNDDDDDAKAARRRASSRKRSKPSKSVTSGIDDGEKRTAGTPPPHNANGGRRSRSPRLPQFKEGGRSPEADALGVSEASHAGVSATSDGRAPRKSGHKGPTPTFDVDTSGGQSPVRRRSSSGVSDGGGEGHTARRASAMGAMSGLVPVLPTPGQRLTGDTAAGRRVSGASPGLGLSGHAPPPPPRRGSLAGSQRSLLADGPSLGASRRPSLTVEAPNMQHRVSLAIAHAETAFARLGQKK